MNSNPDGHAFKAAPSDASRSPCPALNALSSHGYLPRSGRDISFLQLVRGIHTVYNTSFVLSMFLAAFAFLLCGPNGKPTLPFLGTIDLHDLARHNRIEHDASLAHADAAPGAVFAPTSPDIALLAELLAEAESDGRESLNLTDIARVRSRREIALLPLGKKLNYLHAEITRGEVALILSVIGDGEKVSTRRLRTWMAEDMLPEGWCKPQKSVGLLDTMRMARKVKAAVCKEKQKEGQVTKADKKD